MSDARNQPPDGGTFGDAARARSANASDYAGTHGDFPERDELEPDRRARTAASGADEPRCGIDEMPNVEELDEQRWTAELSPDDMEND